MLLSHQVEALHWPLQQLQQAPYVMIKVSNKLGVENLCALKTRMQLLLSAGQKVFRSVKQNVLKSAEITKNAKAFSGETGVLLVATLLFLALIVSGHQRLALTSGIATSAAVIGLQFRSVNMESTKKLLFLISMTLAAARLRARS